MMDRLFFIILSLSLLSCEEQAPFFKGGETGYVQPVTIGHEIPGLLPPHYDIELIDADSLHPVMQITASKRVQRGGSYEWEDAVLRLDITKEQGVLLRPLLYKGPLFPFSGEGK